MRSKIIEMGPSSITFQLNETGPFNVTFPEKDYDAMAKRMKEAENKFYEIRNRVRKSPVICSVLIEYERLYSKKNASERFEFLVNWITCFIFNGKV